MKICVMINDLIFLTRIRAAASACQLDTKVARTSDEAILALQDPDCRLLIVDMETIENTESATSISAAAARTGVTTVAYYPHVRGDLEHAAKEAGASIVLPRSQFAAELPQLLKTFGSLDH